MRVATVVIFISLLVWTQAIAALTPHLGANNNASDLCRCCACGS